MSFIYPECPECGNKASKGNAPGLYDMPVFEWQCGECGYIHKGRFYQSPPGVQWIDSREPGLVGRIKSVFS